MMATEATTGRPVDDIVTSDSEPSIKINDAAQHVDDNAPSVNGAVSPDEVQNKILTDIVDDLVNSADPSISGGSDTENSRTDLLKSKDGDKGHLRSSSAVKKPATFKSVSVNKTFLAAKGAGTAAQAKLADKPAAPAGLPSTASATASSSARPRLVAKSGGLVARAAGASGPAAAPDASAVWNKNRPVPPPEPKKFTDEELKKHGIHMATRLQSGDAPPGQSNWADIDDDDDWVPEEIRWTDGTKSTIHGDEAVMPNTLPAPPMPSLPEQAKPAEMPQIPTPLPEPTMAPAPTPAPAPIKSAVLQSGRGLVLKGAPEKPTLVAKPPAPPTPVKSPWATLPPVEKASPAVTDPPQSMHPQRYQMRGPDMPQGPTPPPYEEIAADDFSRASFGDGPSHSNRELYNSHSGRLEPVMDRRGGPRGDSYMKQPPASLLQRSSQSDHPEPSAAFQTHRTSGQEGPYGRRRGSSIVSGGSSGMLAARMAQSHDPAMPGPPPELLNTRRGSLTAVSDSPSSPRNYSPSGQRFQGQQPWMPRPSPSISHATPYNATSQADLRTNPQAQQQAQQQAHQQGMGGNTESELEMQKRIMREGREAAKQRRLQEEERLEAEKRERIRLKLEALGPAPERKSAKKEPPIVPSARHEADAKIMAQPHNSSLPIDGQQQVGTAQNVAQNSSADATVQILPNGQPSQSAQFAQPSSAEHALAGQDSQHTDSQSIPQSQPWQSGATTSDRLPTWGSAAQATLRNVWGAPSNTNRILGNGTFSSDLNRVASDSFTSDVNMMPPAKPAPGPIGPPGPRATSANIQPIGPPKVVAKDTQAVRNAWASAVKSSDVELNAEQRNKRLEQNRELAARGLNREDLASNVRHNWKPTVVGNDGRRIEKAVEGVVVHKSSGLNDGKDTHTAEGTPAQPPQVGAAQPTARSSRFFPAQDIRKEEADFAGQGRSQSPSPPPPDMFGHPAFDGDMARPHVSLPQPRIVVRLPPKDDQSPTEQPGAQDDRPMYGATSSVLPASSGPSNWKSKIEDLLKGDKQASVPRTLPTIMNADSLVSLFSKHHRNLNNGVDGSVETEKPSVDCFGEQEMGSLPIVSIPGKDLYQDLNYVAVTEDNLLPRTLMVKPNTIETRHLMRDCFGHFRTVPVKLEGMAVAKEFHLPPLPGRETSNPRERPYNRSGRGRGRGPPSHGGSSSASGPSSGNPGRGSYRQRNRSENWSRGTAGIQT